MRLLRFARRICLAALAFLCGCGSSYACGPMYGVVIEPAYGMPPPPHDPTVQITDFSYTPASPIHVGDELTFNLELNKPTGSGYVQVAIGVAPIVATPTLRDDGLPPDTQADDGRYAASLVWDASLPLLVDAPVTGHMYWLDGAADLTRSAAPLTILEAEQGP